jgi:Flp pilus assembly protein TadG
MQNLSLSWARLRASAPSEAVRRFLRETDASMTVEAVLVLPFYLQFFVAAYAFFDAFRTASVNEKAAYTIADVITRRNAGAPVDTDYINWLNTLFDYMLQGRTTDTWIRVTSVTYSDIDGRYEVEWSVATRGHDALDTQDANAMAGRLPIMPGGDTVILVETETRFGIGYSNTPGFLFSALGDQQLNTFIFTRPRFAPRIEFSS